MIVKVKFECGGDPVSTSILKLLSESNPRVRPVILENAFAFEGQISEISRIFSAIRQATDVVTAKYVTELEKK
jgi:hypothetical protein